MVTILNTSILTNPGIYKYYPITESEAKKTVEAGFESAIGHESTAKIISALLQIDCRVNRIQFSQEKGDIALVFKLNGRPPEGAILTEADIKKIGYSWGILEKIDKEGEL